MNHLGQYIPGRTVLHELDPRVKIASVVILSMMILTGGIFTGIVICFLYLVLFSLSQLRPRHILRAVRPMAPIFALLFFMHLIFTKGTPIPPFPPWDITITYEGLEKGALVSWQFVLLVLYAYLLTLTTSSTKMVMAIEKLLGPLKILRVPSHDIAMMVSIALRFVPTLLEEMTRMKEAQMARGANFHHGSLMRRLRAVISLVLPVTTNAFRRADDLATAMEARAYQRGPRTYLHELRLSRKDYGALALILLMGGLYFTGDLLPWV